MTETVQIPWAPGAKFFRVVCRIGQPIPDGADTDPHPDLMTLGGTVELSLSTPLVRYQEADGRWRMLSMPVDRLPIDPATGAITLPVVPGQPAREVWLLDTSSPGVDPQGAAYKATVRPSVGPSAGQTWTVVFDGVQPSGEVDLVRVSALPTVREPEPSYLQRLALVEDAINEGLGGSGPVSSESITDATATGKTLLTAGDAQAAREAIGAQPAGSYALTSQIPSVAGLASTNYVDDQIAALPAPPTIPPASSADLAALITN